MCLQCEILDESWCPGNWHCDIHLSVAEDIELRVTELDFILEETDIVTKVQLGRRGRNLCFMFFFSFIF